MTQQQIYKQQFYKTRYETRKANHQCVDCGCDLPEDAKTLKCEKCRIKAKRYLKKHFQVRKDNGLCRRCGFPLPQGTIYKACFKCRQEECRKRSAKNEQRTNNSI